MARTYTMNKRAKKQEETRQRIVEAAVALHEDPGPARTTISAIAERAGVERLTVYRHFATEEEIFDACSAHFESMHPMPDARAWENLADPRESLTRGLEEIYRYYESAEPMLSSTFRDAELVPAMNGAVERYTQHFEGVFTSLCSRWQASSDEEAQRIAAAIRLVMAFETWRVLARESDLVAEEAVALSVKMVEAASGHA